MRSEEEILKDVRACMGGRCSECAISHNDITHKRSCVEFLIKELEEVIDNYKVNAEPAVTEDDMELARNKGMEEAWEIAEKVSELAFCGEVYNVFNEPAVLYVFRNHSAQEAKEMLKKYKEECIDIEDIVEYQGAKAIVLDIDRDDAYYIFSENGCVEVCKKKDLKKVGERVKLDGLLKQIRGHKEIV